MRRLNGAAGLCPGLFRPPHPRRTTWQSVSERGTANAMCCCTSKKLSQPSVMIHAGPSRSARSTCQLKRWVICPLVFMLCYAILLVGFSCLSLDVHAKAVLEPS
eukprot:6737599-Pyramimonas_sp.AAC.1